MPTLCSLWKVCCFPKLQYLQTKVKKAKQGGHPIQKLLQTWSNIFHWWDFLTCPSSEVPPVSRDQGIFKVPTLPLGHSSSHNQRNAFTPKHALSVGKRMGFGARETRTEIPTLLLKTRIILYFLLWKRILKNKNKQKTVPQKMAVTIKSNQHTREIQWIIAAHKYKHCPPPPKKN